MRLRFAPLHSPASPAGARGRKAARRGPPGVIVEMRKFYLYRVEGGARRGRAGRGGPRGAEAGGRGGRAWTFNGEHEPR